MTRITLCTPHTTSSRVFSHNTLPTLLDAASPSVTWKYYTNQPKPTSTNNIWNAPAAIQEICYPLTPPNLPNGAQCGGYDYVNDVVVAISLIESWRTVSRQRVQLGMLRP